MRLIHLARMTVKIKIDMWTRPGRDENKAGIGIQGDALSSRSFKLVRLTTTVGTGTWGSGAEAWQHVLLMVCEFIQMEIGTRFGFRQPRNTGNNDKLKTVIERDVEQAQGT